MKAPDISARSVKHHEKSATIQRQRFTKALQHTEEYLERVEPLLQLEHNGTHVDLSKQHLLLFHHMSIERKLPEKLQREIDLSAKIKKAFEAAYERRGKMKLHDEGDAELLQVLRTKQAEGLLERIQEIYVNRHNRIYVRMLEEELQDNVRPGFIQELVDMHLVRDSLTSYFNIYEYIDNSDVFYKEQKKEVYYACIEDSEGIPIIYLVFSFRKEAEQQLVLHAWVKSLVRISQIEEKTATGNIGGLVLSLLTEVASLLHGKFIRFLFFDSLSGTDRVIRYLQENQVVINLYETNWKIANNDNDFLENNPDFIVVNASLRRFWRRFIREEEVELSDSQEEERNLRKRQRAAMEHCISCGIVQSQLYWGKNNLLFCGNECHRFHFSLKN